MKPTLFIVNSSYLRTYREESVQLGISLLKCFFGFKPETRLSQDIFLSCEISLELSGDAGAPVLDGSGLGSYAHPEILHRLAAKVAGGVGVGVPRLLGILATTRYHRRPLDSSPGSVQKGCKGRVDLVGFADGHEGRPNPELLLESLSVALGRDDVEHFFQGGVVALVSSRCSTAVRPRLPALLRSPNGKAPEAGVPVAVPLLVDDHGGRVDPRLRWHEVLEDGGCVHAPVLVVVHPLGHHRGNVLELEGGEGGLDKDGDAEDFCEVVTRDWGGQQWEDNPFL